ncbi:MAG TPA: type IV pilus assembly protein PilM [Tepidisphaeraceae bacterium]|nr:type IV pilus assembly protein PilM [Tepidisphaeraceae bacterium]
MANARFAWGIDIGNRALKAVKLVPDGEGRYRIDDFELIEHETVLSSAGDNRESLVQSAIANFVQRHPVKGSGIVAIGVSGQQSFARFIKLPPVEPKKIPEIVRFEAIQQIPFPLDEVEWSYQLFQDPQSPDVEVGIFAMRKEMLNRQIGYFTDVDMNVQVVQTSPLAVYNAMYYDGRIDGTTMFVDLGAENTDLIIADGETVWLRSIPIGGNNFTEALVKAFKLNFAKAEDLKRNASSSKYARQIFQAMRPVFADLVGEIQRSIGFYASVHRDSRISKVMVLGGTFRLPSLRKYLEQNLQLPVQLVDRLGAGAPAEAKMAATFNENLLSTITAYGLALQAMGDGKITSSLLPAHIRRETAWRAKTKWFGLAAALFIAGTGVKMASVQLAEWKYEQAAGAREQIAATATKAQSLDSGWAAVESAGQADRDIIKNVASLTQYRETWHKIMADIHAAALSTNPQPELASGDPKEITKILRRDRNLVQIDSVNSVYRPDLANVLTMSETEFRALAAGEAGNAGAGASRGGPPGFPMGGAPAADPAAAIRGYIVTLRVTTPNAGGYRFIADTLMKALTAINANAAYPGRSYYIPRATIVRSNTVGQRLGPAAGPRAGGGGAVGFVPPAFGGPGGPSGVPPYGPPPGMMGGGPFGGAQGPYGAGGPGGMFGGAGGIPAVANNAAQPVDPHADPTIPGEKITNDTEATLVFAVVLDPPPPAPANTEGQQAAAAAQ